MNHAKLDTWIENLGIMEADEAIAADMETLTAELTKVIIDGEAPAAKLGELAPLLIGFKRAGMDPVAAVTTAIAAARIRAAKA